MKSPWHLQEQWKVTVAKRAEVEGSEAIEFTLSGTKEEIQDNLKDNTFLLKHLPEGVYGKLVGRQYELERIL